MFFKKKTKFPDYFAMIDPASRMIEIYGKKFKNFMEKRKAKDDTYQFITIEESTKYVDKYYCFDTSFPKEIALYLKHNAPKGMITYDDYGHMIGFEFFEELDEDCQ